MYSRRLDAVAVILESVSVDVAHAVIAAGIVVLIAMLVRRDR